MSRWLVNRAAQLLPGCVSPAAPSKLQTESLGDRLRVCSLGSSPEVSIVPSAEQNKELRDRELATQGYWDCLAVPQCLGSNMDAQLFYFIFRVRERE